MKKFFNPLYWFLCIAFTVLRCLTFLPIRWQLHLGSGLGKILSVFPTRLKHITKINIGLCFPNLSSQEQKTLVKNNFASLGMAIMETAMAWYLPEKRLHNLFHLVGLKNVEAAFKKNKGIILVSPHFMCLEIIGRLLGMKYQFAVTYKPHKKKFLADMQEKWREKYHIQTIPHHRLRELFHALQRNRAVWYAYDVDAGEKHSVFAPFFNIPTASLTTVSRIAERSGAAVIPIHFYRREDKSGYDILLSPALEHFPTTDFVSDATRLNKILEEAIRKTPEQYIWQYKRFKTRPSGEKRFY